VSRPQIADRSRDVELRTILSELTRQVLDELALEGVPAAEARTALVVDCRYEGQSHELRVPVHGGPSFALIGEAFHAAHRERFGFAHPDARIEAITFRASALGPVRDVTTSAPSGGAVRSSDTWRIGGVDVAVYERSHLPSGGRITGPAIVTELDSTTWLDERSTAEVHPSGALIVSVG
jgi:N-methylhydantoinase A